MDEVTVFRTWDEPMAAMAVDLLKAEGINAVRIADVPRNVLPFSINGLGEIEIRVMEDEEVRALEILSARFSGEDGVPGRRLAGLRGSGGSAGCL